MIESLRVALIVLITAVDYVAHETIESYRATRDFVRYRVRWILREKGRAMVARWRR